ncbi:RNA-binding protein Cip2 [Schizosaccharomyces cryophilus OY26]|uniref:RNA-binding protein Cip2 n=1 Tax=Schizosaccharomyces cryophilus (strain OY26 / ATCC MYA-4695 / CBS 11777 / NBRC 106824 / NRRL Y48691) TaxID=653667 RepID=S9W294_SCHCR|nr:RNA-binding protein Cip2 [Schizosaccharomyces cryophilus OY26]EPY52489.1 RNA-binding protein Cip2 [Schizosaccharomyces cryophilus OY26]
MAEGTGQRPLTPLSQAFLSTNTLSPASSPLGFHSDMTSLRKKRGNLFPKLEELNGNPEEEQRGMNMSSNPNYFELRWGQDRSGFPGSTVSTPGIGGPVQYSHMGAEDSIPEGATTALPTSLQQMLDPETMGNSNDSLKTRRTRLQAAWKEASNSAGLSLQATTPYDVLNNSGPATTSVLSSTTRPLEGMLSYNDNVNSHNSSAANAPGAKNLSSSQVLPSAPEAEEETIPTAIVIKNIPFSLKKEVLFKVFTALDIPRPYAFNYHFDNGVFRGLAFANFHTPEEAKTVVQVLNGYEITGRRLRVEWKRQLPPAERERVERGKQEKRAVEERKQQLKLPFSVANLGVGIDFDLNDPAVLNVYSHILLFYHRTDNPPDLVFDGSTGHDERRVAALLASRLNLNYSVTGDADSKQVVITSTNHQVPGFHSSSANQSPAMSNAHAASELGSSSVGMNNIPSLSSSATLQNSMASSGIFDNNPFSGSTLSSNLSSLRRPAPSLHLADSIRSLRGISDVKPYSDIRSMPATPLELSSQFLNMNVSSPLERDLGTSSGALNGNSSDYFSNAQSSSAGVVGSKPQSKNDH